MSYSQYTPEQLEKIEKLRSEAEEQRIAHKKEVEWLMTRKPWDKEFEVGERVYVVIDGLTVIGYLVEKRRDKVWMKDTRTTKKRAYQITYDVSTPYGVLKNIGKKNLRERYYRDLSHVVIPEELKAISTQDLITEVRRDYTGYYADWDRDNYRPERCDFTTDEIRAELRNRPNVRRNKKVKKTLKKYM